MLGLRAVYSLGEPTSLANVSRSQLGRMLAKARGPSYRSGRKRWHFLSDIKKGMPSLWESIEDVGR